MSEHHSPIYNLLRNFFRCGLIGWCMEIIYTALVSLRRRNFRLTGTTSLWMFPIYGCASFLKPLFYLLKKCSVWIRGLTYMSLIFSTEFLTGSFLKRRNLCPWDYSRSRYRIGQVVRLDYAPLWFGIGLLFEHALVRPRHARHSSGSDTVKI